MIGVENDYMKKKEYVFYCFNQRLYVSILLLLVVALAKAQTPNGEELVKIHSVSATEMDAILNPIEGSFAFNTNDRHMYQFDGMQLKR